MYFVIDNATPLHVVAMAHEDLAGRPSTLIVAKGCWRLDTGRMAPTEHQMPLRTKPARRRIGDLGLDLAQRHVMADRLEEEIIWLDHELCPPKPCFDVIVAGNAHAPEGALPAHFDAAVRVGERAVVLRAFAPRCRQSSRLLGAQIVNVAAGVGRVPMSYAFAGGAQGLAEPSSREATHWLPWLENPHPPATPAGAAWGFGHWPENADHRRAHAGRYDDAWRRERSPRLPLDFDDRFHNSAHPALQWPEAPPAGTPIRLINLASSALIDTRYPDLTLAVRAAGADGVSKDARMRADTLLIEPDDNRLSVIWRASLSIAQAPGRAGTVRIYPTSRSLS